MITALMVIDAIICILLIASVMLQSGKGGGMGEALSGGGGAVIGGMPKGFDAILEKMTMVLATLFGIVTLVIVKLTA